MLLISKIFEMLYVLVFLLQFFLYALLLSLNSAHFASFLVLFAVLSLLGSHCSSDLSCSPRDVPSTGACLFTVIC